MPRIGAWAQPAARPNAIVVLVMHAPTLHPPPAPPCLAAASAGRGARQAPASAYARHFARLLENQGSWEAARGHTTAGRAPPFMAPPPEAWEGLGQHVPELAEVAAGAADVASSLQYFEVGLCCCSCALQPARCCWRVWLLPWGSCRGAARLLRCVLLD